MKTYALWGRHSLYAHGVPIKITVGTLAECQARLKPLQRREDWRGLAILESGTPYAGSP